MEEGQRDLLVSVASYALLFLLVFGLSGTVELQAFRAQFRDKKGILIGVLCQFVLLPFCGFCSVKAFYLPPVYGITLLIVCSSPGGSYSNFWCSVVNADLALSVAMTTVSSLIAMAALPLNTLLYVHTTYKSHKDDIQIDWVSMGTALGVVMVAVAGGLFVGDRFRRLRGTIHSMGNAAGLCLILLGLVYSSLSRENSEPLWSRGWQFYVATAIPCLVGLVSSLLLSRLAGLPRPQSLSVCIETCYQNTGIAFAVALSMFSGSEASLAAGLPVFYQMCQMAFIISTSLVLFKFGWTYAPPSTPILLAALKKWQPGSDGTPVRGAAALTLSPSHMRMLTPPGTGGHPVLSSPSPALSSPSAV